jgi:hypothetical protein
MNDQMYFYIGNLYKVYFYDKILRYAMVQPNFMVKGVKHLLLH